MNACSKEVGRRAGRPGQCGIDYVRRRKYCGYKSFATTH